MSIVDPDGNDIDLKNVDDAKAPEPDAPSSPTMRAWKVTSQHPDKTIRAHSVDLSRTGALVFYEYQVVKDAQAGGYRAVPRITVSVNHGHWQRLEEIVVAPESVTVH